MKTGSCTSRGRQPPRGLTPCSFWSFCISSASFCRSFLYFSCSFLICGWNSCIFRIERTWLMKGLISSARRVKTRKMTESAQPRPLAGPRTKLNTSCQNHMIPDTG